MSRRRHRGWDKFARAVKVQHLRKNGAVCSRCKRVSGELECHHRRPIESAPELEMARSNIEIICRECHLTHHRKPLAPDQAAWKRLIEAELLNA